MLQQSTVSVLSLKLAATINFENIVQFTLVFSQKKIFLQRGCCCSKGFAVNTFTFGCTGPTPKTEICTLGLEVITSKISF